MVFGLTAWGLAHKVKSLHTDIDTANGRRMEAVKDAERDYNKTVQTVEKIVTKYKTEYVAIETFKKDRNETDCNASIRLINSTIF